MTPERWKQIDELAQAALEHAGGERASFLDDVCNGDVALRREVESQIAYQQQASKFLEEPAFKHAAESIADPQTETESMEGRTISHYSILRKLGAGGMGEVYLAQDTSLNRKVAIKFLSQNSIAGEQGRKRLVREAKAAAALDHPHICAVYEVCEEGGRSFIVMQYVEGETLASRIQRRPLEVREALEIAVQIVDALAEAHSHRIIHRDVKPQNVMLTTSGQVKVLDFGLARVVHEGSLIDSIGETESLLTAPGSVIGTVPYMSPEQVRGEALDGRSDIFSFGAVLYEMLSGRQPFQGESVGATLSSILTKDPAPLARYASEVPDELQRVVRKALSKDKEGRYQGIKDLLIDLRELKQELEFEAKLERSIEPLRRDRSATPEQGETGGRAEPEARPQQTVHTGEALTKSTTSSTRVVIGEIRRHKLGVSLTLAAMVVAAGAGYFYFNRPPVLTDKDTILLADFVNTTGDADLDGTLKMALAVQLEQSPFLNLFSDERVRETLRYMERSPDERVTKEIAREICERQGLKALMAGRVSNLGSHYVIALEVINAHTRDVLVRVQEEAESKEQVLRTLGQAAIKLREKLGESLSSIQKFDAPIEQVTTTSLEALKAYDLAHEANLRGNHEESIKQANRALDLDPNFMRAYQTQASNYASLGQWELSIQLATKAFELRDRVSELERLQISQGYYISITGELDKATETLEYMKKTYPRSGANNNLGNQYAVSGQYEKAIEAYREAITLNPKVAICYYNLARSFVYLNRIAEAKEILNQAFALKLDIPPYHFLLYVIAFINGDRAEMKQQVDWANSKQGEFGPLNWQSWTAAFAGQGRQARAFSNRAFDAAEGRNAKEDAANIAITQALTDGAFGNCEQVKEGTAKGIALAHTASPLWNAAVALATCSEVGRAEALVDEYSKRFPKNTLGKAIWLPTIRATIELRRNNPARAIDLLEGTKQYEAAAKFLPPYTRGQAYLKLRKGSEAAAEFQKILDHRGWDPTSYLYPLAHLGLARAAALTGDVATSRKTYQDFFALWKDADADLPVLIDAKKEYAALK
ncbi:MAG TPA: protein kinase [Blastocatellia bacterium]|nr:protein kinase [Blastocatellia bacterium]